MNIIQFEKSIEDLRIADTKFMCLLNILNAILSANGRAYFVGGCVRDLLLHKVPHDWDIVTNLKPNELITLFKGYNVDLVGKNFGVIVVDSFEIATFRKDVYSAEMFHRKGADKIEFANTIEEDLSRRDLTINAIAIEYSGNPARPFERFIDPFNGVENLNKRIVSFVGDANERIKEDPCRILRACRFACLQDTAKAIDNKSLVAMYNNRRLFFLIAPERIRLEVMKAASQFDNFDVFINYLTCIDILRYIFPLLAECKNIEGGQHHAEDVYDHCVLAARAVSKKYPLIRIAALLHDSAKPQVISKDEQGLIHFYGHEQVGSFLNRTFFHRLRFSKREVAYMCELIKKHMFYFEEITKDATYRRFMSNMQIPVRDLLRLRIADRRGNMAKNDRPTITFMFKKTLLRIRRIEREDKCLKLTDLVINGNDLILMGYQPGPTFRLALEHCLAHVLEEPGRNNREYLTNVVEEFMKQYNNLKGG